MEDFVKTFTTPDGDVYEIALTEETRLLSSEMLNQLGNAVLASIDLRRLSGENVTKPRILVAIENAIAEFFLKNEDVIIFYYCDFVNKIPNTLKNTMPPQEYRSRLFEKLFQRYIRLHNIRNVRLSVIEINGINEKYYFYVIYRERHSMLAALIGSDLKEGYEK